MSDEVQTLIREIDPEATRDLVLARAVVGFHKFSEGGTPSLEASSVQVFEGRVYVVLRDSRRSLLAVYRYRVPSGDLRRLKEWPSEIA